MKADYVHKDTLTATDYVELNKKYENAVADYETTMSELQELKKQFEEKKDKINWYENFEINKTIDKLRIKHNNQQKEFIEYLEDEIKNIQIKWGNKLTENGYIDIAMTVRAYQIILQKYKEIIGGK